MRTREGALQKILDDLYTYPSVHVEMVAGQPHQLPPWFRNGGCSVLHDGVDGRFRASHRVADARPAAELSGGQR